MANWKHKIELNKVLADMGDKHDLSSVEEPCPDGVKEAIATELAKARPLQKFCTPIRKAVSIAAVNRILDRVYDEADRSLVWCGIG